MIAVSLKGLLGRKLRTALTAFAIVLGVAMVSGTYVLTDTIDKAFANLFSQTYAETDARITGKAVDISVQGESAPTPGVPEQLLDDVRAVPGVSAAAGMIFDEQTKLIDKDGQAIAPEAPTFAFGVDVSPALQRFNPTELIEGRWPSGPDEVVIDASTADQEGYRVGETIGVLAGGPSEEFEIVGVAQYGGVDSLGNATFAVFDVPTAQSLLDRRGELDEIFVGARNGVSDAQLVRELEAALPGSVEVQTGTEAAETETDEVTSFTNVIEYFLLAFAGIALFVGAFVIFNTLSITVAQRTRELATLRTIGASRRQVLGSVVLESFVIGLLSAATGLGLGVALAYGLKALFAAVGAELPEVGMVLALRTVIVSLLVGVVVTLLAGLFPALKATRVPPIAAVREGAELPKSRLAFIVPWAGGATVTLAVALLGYSLFVDGLGIWERLLSMVCGCLALFIGVALLSSRLVRPLAWVVGWPARRIGGVAGKLAYRNSRRNPGPNGRDRRGADDRHRARHLRRGARERDEGLQPRCDRAAAGRRLHRHLPGWLLALRRGCGRGGPACVGRVRRHERPHRPRQGRRLRQVHHRHRAGLDRSGLPLRLEVRLERGAGEARTERRDHRRRVRRGERPPSRRRASRC